MTYARRPLAIAVPWAAFRDAMALGATVARFVAVDPLSCRLRGHRWHVWATDRVEKVCDRCGRLEDAY